MKKADVINHFGSQAAAARALGITPESVSQWGDTIPPLRAYQIERLTVGELKSDEGMIGKRPYVRIAPGTKPEDFPCVKGSAATKEQAEKE